MSVHQTQQAMEAQAVRNRRQRCCGVNLDQAYQLALSRRHEDSFSICSD
jgi:hypothetical protein